MIDDVSQPDASPSAGQQGFTLIEIIIALTIFAFGLLSASLMQSASIKGNKSASAVGQSSTWASSKMEEILSWPYDDSRIYVDSVQNTTTGAETSPDGAYTVSWNVTNNTPVTNTKTVVITVSWSVRGVAKSSQFTSILSQPI